MRFLSIKRPIYDGYFLEIFTSLLKLSRRGFSHKVQLCESLFIIYMMSYITKFLLIPQIEVKVDEKNLADICHKKYSCKKRVTPYFFP